MLADDFREFETNLAYHFSEALEKPLAKPYWIYLSLSHKCTYECQMCGVVKILKGYELPTEMLIKAFDQIAAWKWDCVLTITGGEPFLRKDIFDIINDASAKGLRIEVVSNGALIDEALAQRIVSSGLENIAVSFDGACEITHDSIREKGAFRKARDAVKNLVMAKKVNGKGPQISVWTTIMKENVKELFDVIPLARDLGVECLVYHPVIVTQDDMQNTSSNAPFWIRQDTLPILKEQIDKIMEYKNKYSLVAFLHNPYLWIKYFEGTLTKKDWKCNPFVFINIGPDGEMRSCGSAFGNIKRIELNECLNSQEAFQARRLMKVCEKPCLQTCWAYPQADSLTEIVNSFISNLRQSNADKQTKSSMMQEAWEMLTRYEAMLNRKNAQNK